MSTERRGHGDEPSEYDVIGGLPPGAPSSAETCPDFADAEIGQVVRLLMREATTQQIAARLGIKGSIWMRRLMALIAEIRALGKRKYEPEPVASTNGRRPRGLTLRQARRVHELHAHGHSEAVIAAALAVKPTAVGWELEHPREGL